MNAVPNTTPYQNEFGWIHSRSIQTRAGSGVNTYLTVGSRTSIKYANGNQVQPTLFYVFMGQPVLGNPRLQPTSQTSFAQLGGWLLPFFWAPFRPKRWGRRRSSKLWRTKSGVCIREQYRRLCRQWTNAMEPLWKITSRSTSLNHCNHSTTPNLLS